MNPACAEHEELLRISQERVKRLEEERDALRAVANVAVDFVATVDGVYVRYGRRNDPDGLAQGRAELHAAIQSVRDALKSHRAALRPEGT